MARLLLAFWVCFVTVPALAHDVRPGAVAMRELTAGEFAVAITPAEDGGGSLVRPTPVWPNCQAEGQRVQCAPGTAVQVELPNLAAHRVKVLVTLHRLDGSWSECVLREEETSCRLDIAPTATEVFVRYTRSGVDHFASGTDHVLFVGAILLVLGFRRKLIIAVTGFTLGHSVSLFLASRGLASLNVVVVEILIAASVVHLARESLVRQDTWTVRFPAAVSTTFGLLHGLGFASVLREYGLPDAHQLTALAGFNVGLELAQLALIAIAAVFVAVATRLVSPPHLQRAARLLAYAIGACAAYWTLDRTLLWVMGE